MFNNAFPIHPHNTTLLKKTTTPNSQTTTTTRKWATFTYVGRQTTFIINLFKKTDLRIALLTNDTMQRLLMHNKLTRDKTDKYTQSRVYKLTCPDCNKTYVGQTGRMSLARFNEHKAAFKTNNNTSDYAKHLIEQTHSFSTIHNTMQILKRHNKGAYLNSIER